MYEKEKDVGQEAEEQEANKREECKEEEIVYENQNQYPGRNCFT